MCWKRVNRLIVGALLSAVFLVVNAEIYADWTAERQVMVHRDLRGRDISDDVVLNAMLRVRRHLFVPESVRQHAYVDRPLPIGNGQTISQPYVVALMSQLLEIEPGMKVLEIGTGSGYQAAVLQAMGADVYSIEIIADLAIRTEALYRKLKLPVRLKTGDGYFGWNTHAPYDRIIITAAANHIPRPLLDQLKPGGKLILPLGNIRFYQTLTLVTLLESGRLDIVYHSNVRFVPMTGKILE